MIKQCSLNPKNITNSILPLNIHNSILSNDENLKTSLGICSLHFGKHNTTGVSLSFHNPLMGYGYLAQLSVLQLCINYAPKQLKFRTTGFQVRLCLARALGDGRAINSMC